MQVGGSGRGRARPRRIDEEEPWWLLGPGGAGRVAAWGLFFLLLCYLPLRGADLWADVSYGGWILDRGELPAEDPFLPLAAGMEVVDGEWLSQVLLAAVERWAGPEGLSVLFALSVTLTYLLLSRAFRRASRSALAGGLGVLAALGIGWSRIASLRPETFGMLAFAALIWLLASDGGRLRLWLGVPLVMALWANSDGSFLAGLALLWGRALGAAFDAAVTERSAPGSRAFGSKSWPSPTVPGASPRRLGQAPGVRQRGTQGVRGRFWLAELATAATLVNPYGLDLLLHRLGLAGGNEVSAARPLTLAGPGGVECALALLALLAVARFSRFPLPAADLLPLAVFGAAAALRVDRVSWLAPVAALMLVPHLPALLGREEDDEDVPYGSMRWTLIAAGVLWLVFAFSPLATPILGSTPRTPEQLFESTSPALVADYLYREPPAGQLFHPAAWGDWLVREGRSELVPFAGADLGRLPRRVWGDYLAIAEARGDWPRLLERYRVETVVVDRETQPALARALRASPDWRRVHHDPQALVFMTANRTAPEDGS